MQGHELTWRTFGRLLLVWATLSLLKPVSSTLISGVSISPGILQEQLPPPIFYHRYVPAVLEYKTPRLNKTEVTFNNWFNCSSEKYPYSLSCPVVFHLNSAIQNLHVDFESLYPGKDDEDHSHLPFFESLSRSRDFCFRILSHFPGMYTNSKDVDFYLERLRLCSKTLFLERNITDYRYSIRFPFSRMEYNFYATFYQVVNSRAKDPDTKLLASASLSNSRTAIQGSVIASFYAERNRWNFAVGRCLLRRLPTSVVTGTKLESVLNSVATEGEDEDYELAVPNSTFSKYFDLPIADCTHTQDDFIVRLLIPVKSTTGGEYQLRAVHPIQFALRDQQQRLCFLKSVEESNYIFDLDNGLAYKSDCQSNELCQLTPDPRPDPCVSMIFTKNVTGILQHCRYECEAGMGEFPSILPFTNNTYVISGGDNLKISCGGDDSPHEELEEASFPFEGTLKVEFQDSSPLCRLTVSGGKRKIVVVARTTTPGVTATPSNPSNSGSKPYTISALLPLNMVKKEYLRNEEETEFGVDGRPEDILEIPAAAQESPIRGGEAAPPLSQVQEGLDVGSSHALLYCYITLLTVVLAGLGYCQYLMFKRMGSVSNSNDTNFFPKFKDTGSGRGGGGGDPLLLEECEFH